jgi:hypothetical protein
MSLHFEAGISNDAELYQPDSAPVVAKRKGPALITPFEFLRDVVVADATDPHCVVKWGVSKQPNDHAWSKNGGDAANFLASKSDGLKPAYFSIAAYRPGTVSRWQGRVKDNASALRVFCLDIEGSAKKYAKPDGPQKGYPYGVAAIVAVNAFVKASRLKPNFVVDTTSGGWHMYFVLDVPLSRMEWEPRAGVLVALAAVYGLKIDAPCTTNAAQIMRVPGSIHQDTGQTVKAYRVRAEAYKLEDFDKLIGYVPNAVQSHAPAKPKADAQVTNDLVGNVEHPKFSYWQAAQQCGAMRLAAQGHGADTSYPVWILAARAAALSEDGPDFAHEISCGHPDYNESDTDKKLDSLTGGPANCETWAAAYGTGGPCSACAHRGSIKNPAIQLGAVVKTTPPGSTETVTQADAAPWVSAMNQRYALVRHGSKVVIADFQTPAMSQQGVTLGMGFLEVAALKQQHKGRTVPADTPQGKPRPLADAWLMHEGRRQYEGLVFAPGETLPGNILNMWQGFAVAPVAADVRLWLRVLYALVPDRSERRYVLCWLAWKIQNPSGVPDTILIFKGAKGTGKNSLFDPIILLFGRHGMLADDPELIAGRFTWHLMSLAFAVLDEAVFVGDPRQADRIKSRVTAKSMHYEQKGMDPVAGVNRCAYVMLTNHEHVWQATTDERRAVVVEVGEGLRGNLAFWKRYHAWVKGPGAAAVLHYLQRVDLTGFNPRDIPKGEALRKQVEQTALRNPAAAWWGQCLTEGAIRWRDGFDRVTQLDELNDTEIDRAALRMSFEQSAAGRHGRGGDWAAVSKKVKSWVGPKGITTVRAKAAPGTARSRVDVLPPLADMRAAFTAATQVQIP